MANEKDLVYEAETELSELNENNLLKPYGYQTLFAQLVEKHLARIRSNVAVTMEYNLAWVFRSLSFELVKPVVGCVKLYGSTWYSQRKGPYFRREFLFRSQEGELMFQGSSYSILMDVEKRTVYRKKEIPFRLPEPTGEFTMEAAPAFKTQAEFTKAAERKVLNSYIDCLGHVNNCRYGEFAYDALTEEECQHLDKLKRMDFFFTHELRNREVFSILKAREDGKILIRGFNDAKETASFEVIMNFRDNATP